jgi:transposase-like protein
MRAVSPNSSRVYHEEIKGATEESQDDIIHKAIKKLCNPSSMRQIQRVTGLEINVVSRSLNNLCQKKQIIEMVENLHCAITGRKVNHYKVKSDCPEGSKE